MKSIVRSWIFASTLSAALFCVAESILAPSAYCQTSFGTISGSVVDATGSAVPNATVKIVSKATGEEHNVITTGNGSYRVEALLPGKYSVVATAAGYAKWSTDAATVNASVVTSVNPTLKVGTAETTVEVSADELLLKTESGDVSATVSSKEITSLPVSTLNSYALALTMPNVTSVTTASFGNGVKFSVNGQRPRSNNFLIEGQDNNDAGIAGQGLQPENSEAQESVTYLMNSAAPEFGRGGMVANLVYKSGSNSFHGSAWDRHLNSALDATDHSDVRNGATKSIFHENIFGFTIGGPVKRNKLFFFVSDQWDKDRESSNAGILTLPTAEGYTTLNKYTANTQIANLIKAYSGLVASSDLSLYPTYHSSISLGVDPSTGADRGSVAVGGYQRRMAQKTDGQELVTKADYIINTKDRLQARLIRAPQTTPYDTSNFPSQLPGFDTMQNGTVYNAGLTEDHVFSPNLLNELRLSYGRIGFIFDLRPETYANSLLGPTVSISGINGYGIPTSTPQGRFHNTYQLQDALSWTKGNHSMKFGFDIARVRVRDAVPFVKYGSISYVANTTGTATYTGLGNYMDDYSGYSSSTSPSLSKYFGNNVARPVMGSQAYYAQDHWKVTSKLTLDYGLRYEYFGAPFNYLAYPAMPADLSCFPCGQKQNPRYTDFGPRLGFAYSLTPKTVIRGGFGAFYESMFTNMADNMQASAPNAATPVLYANTTASKRGVAYWSQKIASLSSTPQATNSVTTMWKDSKTPTTYQWNLAVQQALPAGMTVTAQYTASRGLHLLGLQMVNPVSNVTGLRIYPTRGSVAAFTYDGDSNYQGASVQLEAKTHKGLLFNTSYTYSKDLDDVSEGYTSGNYSAYPQLASAFGYKRGLDWGPSAYDHRHRAVMTLVYTPSTWRPNGLASKIAAKAVNDWTISTITSYQSGSVYDVHVGYDINDDGVSNDRPVLANPKAAIDTFAVSGEDWYGVSGYCDGSYLYNYVKAANRGCHPVTLDQVHWYVGDYGVNTNKIIGRNAAYTPGIVSSDITVERSFSYRGHMLAFRAEMYDWMNHANTGIPAFSLMGGSGSSYPYPKDSYYSSNGYKTNFANYAASASGSRAIRLFLKYSF